MSLCAECRMDVPVPGSDLCAYCLEEERLELEDDLRRRRAEEQLARAEAVREVAG